MKGVFVRGSDRQGVVPMNPPFRQNRFVSSGISDVNNDASWISKSDFVSPKPECLIKRRRFHSGINMHIRYTVDFFPVPTKREIMIVSHLRVFKTTVFNQYGLRQSRIGHA